jgi:hypothetical protein
MNYSIIPKRIFRKNEDISYYIIKDNKILVEIRHKVIIILNIINDIKYSLF